MSSSQLNKLIVGTVGAGILLYSLFLMMSSSMPSYAAFTGPGSLATGTGSGSIGVSGGSLSIGTSSPIGDTKFFVLASSTGSAGFSVKIIQPGSEVNNANDGKVPGIPLFVIRNDGRVGISSFIGNTNTSTIVIGGNVRVDGTLAATNINASLSGSMSAANIQGRASSSATSSVFGANTGGGNYSFPAGLSAGLAEYPTGNDSMLLEGNLKFATGPRIVASSSILRLQAGGNASATTASIFFQDASSTVRARFNTVASSTVYEYLVVGGGGGGGNGPSGGGGGGGDVVTSSAVLSGSYSVVIGNGGTAGLPGASSSLNGTVAIGGGAGATSGAGGSGANGGGGAPTNGGGTGTAGFNGGNGLIDTSGNSNYGGGGGGGDTQAGGNAWQAGPSTQAGLGGAGKSVDYSGAAVVYGSGGGGGSNAYTTPSSGGSGAGTGGVADSKNGGNGTANRGGGGGGAGVNYTTSTGNGTGGTGGSGVVIIRYLGSPIATGGTTSTSGGYTIHTFNASGTFTAPPSYGTLHIGSTNTSQADLAENYNTADKTLKPGDLVVLDKEKSNTQAAFVKKSSGRGDVVLGVVSTNPGVLMNEKDAPQTNDQAPLALEGRVPVKVSAENGAIKVGDRLAASSLPGVAMKATEPGMIVGIALETYNPSNRDEVGKIEVLVKSGYWAPPEGLVTKALKGFRRTYEGLKVALSRSVAISPSASDKAKAELAGAEGSADSKLDVSGSRYVTYGLEGTRPEIRMTGESVLTEGRARIILDASASELMKEDTIKVFLSPRSGVAGELRAEEKSERGFTVVESGGAGSGAFDWLLVAEKKQ